MPNEPHNFDKNTFLTNFEQYIVRALNIYFVANIKTPPYFSFTVTYNNFDEIHNHQGNSVCYWVSVNI